MTIHNNKQPEKLTVLVEKTIPAHPRATNSLENHRKYHCPSSGMLTELRLSCVKSDLIQVVKSCAVCVVFTWMCWLQWSNYQLSVDIVELKNAVASFDSTAIKNELGEDHFSKVQPEPGSNRFDVEHLVYKHSAQNRRRRKRRQRDGKIKEAIHDYMKNNTYTLFLPGINRQTEGYFRWNLTYAGTEDAFVTINSNGTFTFKREGFYLVASQVTVKGIDNQQNYGISYGYKTVLVNDNHEEVLMLSEITQNNRGTCYRTPENLSHCATDSISHSVIRHFSIYDRIAIKPYTNNYKVNYYMTQKNSYFSIVSLDLWNI